MRQRGFTLLELMVTLGAGSILGMTFFGVMVAQTASYAQRLDALDAQQNAAAALDILRHAVQAARFGLGQGARVGGIVPLGRCSDPGNPAVSTGACDNVDGGADRLRVVALVADANFIGDPLSNAGDPCTGTSSTVIEVSNTPPQPFASGALVGIGGTCRPSAQPNSFAAAGDVAHVIADLGAAGGCTHRYTFTLLDGGGGQLSCPAGYQRVFSFGSATVTDFYVGSYPGGGQALYMNTGGGVLSGQHQVVAYNIEDLQVVYGIDLSEVRDHTYEAWCSDPRPGTCDLVDSGGNVIDQVGLYSRIVALRLYLRVRTGQSHPDLLENLPITDPVYLALASHNPVPSTPDGYRRWLYSTEIALRNNNP